MILTTERLLLREFVPGDWQAVLAYQSDSRYLLYYEWTERTEADVLSFVQRFVDQQREQPRTKFQLAVTLAADGHLIGNCGVRKETAEADVAELGYEIAPVHWGQGYATEAAQAMLTFAFGELGLHHVWAHCLAENMASVRVLEKLGMRQEGRLRENQWIKERWWDTLLYGLLADEW